MTKGSYILMIELQEDTRIEIGPGERLLESGYYLYFGSAFGTGGLERIQRHREVASGEREVRHWHIDYLTSLQQAHLEDSLKLPGLDTECEMAQRADEKVDSFGASDCGCRSHLAYFATEEEARDFLRDIRSEYLDS